MILPSIGSLAGAKAGLIAKTIVTQLTVQFSGFGAFLVVAAAFSVGLVVAAEKIAFAIPRLVADGTFALLRIRKPQLSIPSLPFLKFKNSTAVLEDEELDEEV